MLSHGGTTQNALPKNFGVILFPGFQALDVFGPLDALNTLAQQYPIQLFIIAATMDPVSTKIPTSVAPAISNFGESIVPTHTFETTPPLDVLVVPGGRGAHDDAAIQGAIAFVAKIYTSLKYLITVCTGSVIAARAGVLDGRRATTNKRSWDWAKSYRKEVNWVAKARWVVDGNIWTSSGVSAGIDVTFAWITEIYGEKTANEVANILEYERHVDSSWDPFAELYGLNKDSEA